MRLFSFLLVILGAIAVSCTGTDRIASGSTPTSSIPEYGLLLVSTLDGSLTAINSDTGHQRWSFNLGAPLLESPRDPLTGFTFIPDPKDGQIFALQDGALEKLPYTVPQLVKASPSKSGKGVLFAGSKKDVWISINPETGHKLDALPPPPASSYCPVGHPENIFIGRIDYQLSMLDSNKKDVQWNASFTDYSSHLLPPDNLYPFAHFSLPNDGVILTYDARHERLFKTKVSGVIANLYLLKTDGLHLLPHTTISTTLFDDIVRVGFTLF
uniref:Pyrroloquinoline-quinone binding quinoprotein n=1 Tax=Panagrellus redivivus TaxID=6233 RepID=A0A7E4WBW6_PANRE